MNDAERGYTRTFAASHFSLRFRHSRQAAALSEPVHRESISVDRETTRAERTTAIEYRFLVLGRHIKLNASSK